MGSEDVEALVAGLERAVANPDTLAQVAADPKLRDRLSEACRYGMLRLERPWDTLHRLVFGFDTSVAITGYAMGLWKAIVDAGPGGVSVAELVKTTGADNDLLLCLLRYAASHGMVNQSDETTFSASNITGYLTMSGMQAGLETSREQLPSMLAKLPEFLASTQYKRPTKSTETAWTYTTGHQDLFSYLGSQPEQGKHFNDFMSFQREGLKTWLDSFPLDKYLDVHPSSDRVQFCDVAGGLGHQALGVLRKYPSLQGRVLLQDRPDMQALDAAAASGLAVQGLDFFQPNPSPGARVYYMRNILHDWPDADCRVILGHLRDALSPDSVIIIDDIVVPAVNPHWYASTFDMTMAFALGGRERSATEFEQLYDAVGLKRIELFHYDSYGLAVQVLARK